MIDRSIETETKRVSGKNNSELNGKTLISIVTIPLVSVDNCLILIIAQKEKEENVS